MLSIIKRKKGTRKKLIGGNNNSKLLVFYVCYFGGNSHISNKIPDLPSEKYDCYFFSNNQKTLDKLKGTHWKPVFVNTVIKNSLKNSAMDSKELKACPHHFKELNGYKYQCYFDTKILGVNDIEIESYINTHLENKKPVMMVNMHVIMLDKTIKVPSIYHEYDAAMTQERYRIDSEKYKNYIAKQIKNGYKSDYPTHYETSVILRKCGDKVNEINEEWYKHIKETGIECQISFFFIQQIYKGYIIPTSKPYRRPPGQGGGNRIQNYIFIDMLINQGLGNQLYLYAVGLVIKKKTGLPICIIPSKGNTHTDKSYNHLFDSKISTELHISPERIQNAKNVIPDISITTQKWGIDDIKYDITNTGKDITTSQMCYQNYSTIKDVISEVKTTLMKTEFNKDKYKKYNQIKSNETAFIHVRRGDYIKEGWNLPITYYLKGLDNLEKNNSIKTIYIFSNDIEWCKHQKWNEHTSKKIIHDATADELEVLYMMSLCQAGAVISNSTFSSWGVMLGADMNNKSTIVYSLKNPQETTNKTNPYDFPSKWIAI